MCPLDRKECLVPKKRERERGRERGREREREGKKKKRLCRVLGYLGLVSETIHCFLVGILLKGKGISVFTRVCVCVCVVLCTSPRVAKAPRECCIRVRMEWHGDLDQPRSRRKTTPSSAKQTSNETNIFFFSLQLKHPPDKDVHPGRWMVSEETWGHKYSSSNILVSRPEIGFGSC